MNQKLPTLIGVAGTFASGKDTLADYLVAQHSFAVGSTSDAVREISQKRHGNIERPALHETANYYRQKFGADYFAQKILDDFFANQSNNYYGLVITGLRSVGEAQAIKKANGVLVFVNAPIGVRYQRMLRRNRDKEVNLKLEEFAESEKSEWHSGDGLADFSFKNIQKMADINIINGDNVDQYLRDSIKLLLNH
jgi:dephospho-CoA kinase